MRFVERRIVLATSALAVLAVLAGCSPKGGAVSGAKPPTAQAAANDNRMPPQQKAMVEQRLAQQQAAAAQMEERMKNAPKPTK